MSPEMAHDHRMRITAASGALNVQVKAGSTRPRRMRKNESIARKRRTGYVYAKSYNTTLGLTCFVSTATGFINSQLQLQFYVT